MSAPAADSLIDEVDENDRVVGQLERRAAPTSMSGFRTVHVFVVRGGSLLLQQLDAGRERHPGRWGSSVAGYMHAGESYLDGARRRAREELGLTSPLEEVGKLRFQEDAALKFVTLYRTRATDVRNEAPEQISALRWWIWENLEDAVREAPKDFTPTCAALLERFDRDAIVGP